MSIKNTYSHPKWSDTNPAKRGPAAAPTHRIEKQKIVELVPSTNWNLFVGIKSFQYKSAMISTNYISMHATCHHVFQVAKNSRFDVESNHLLEKKNHYVADRSWSLPFWIGKCLCPNTKGQHTFSHDIKKKT